MLESESGSLPCGYDEDFRSPVEEDLQCLICQLPLRGPVLTRCGHRFCQKCLEEHMVRFVLILLPRILHAKRQYDGVDRSRILRPNVWGSIGPQLMMFFLITNPMIWDLGSLALHTD